MTHQSDENLMCFPNTTAQASANNETDDDSFFQCFWNEKTEPTDEYVFFLVNGGTTTILNCIVLIIAFLYVDTRSKPSQIFVIHMTAADLLVGLTVQLSRPFAPCFPSYVCGPYYVIAWMCQMGSVAHLLLLNVDKFLSIRIPLRYQVFVTRRRVSIVTVACWTALFIISVISYTVFLQFRDPQNPSCVAVEFKPGAYYAFLTILAYVAPTIYSFAISAYIFVIAQASSRRLGSISERQRRMLMQRIFFVFSSTMWTFITCLPYRIGFALYIFCIQRHIASLNQTENANATLPAETLIPSDNMPACGNFTISHHKPPGLQISFSWNLLIVRITAADRGKGQNHLALYANSDCALYGIDPDACVGKVGLVAITYMFKLLQVGTVGNPIITIITQRQYRGRVIAAWRAVAKALHMPQWCYSEERREIITEARSTRLGSLNESQAFQIL